MVVIRRAEPRDHAVVGELCVAAYSALGGPDMTGYQDRLRDAAARDREAELWVATGDSDAGAAGEIHGTVTVCHDGSPWREVARGEELEFRMLAVSPAAQGSGVGEALVRMVLDRARESGASAVVLCTMPEMTSAQRLYARLGFVRQPERDWSPAPGIDLLAHRLDLQE